MITLSLCGCTVAVFSFDDIVLYLNNFAAVKAASLKNDGVFLKKRFYLFLIQYMKNIIKSISLVAVLLVALTTISAAHSNSVIATVQNNTTNNLGTVTIYASGLPFYVNVPGQGAFNVTVPTTPTSVVVNSYVIQQGQYGIVTLPSGVKVKVTLSGNIVVIDQTIIQ